MGLLTIFSQTDYSVDPILQTPAPTVQEGSGFGVLTIIYLVLFIFLYFCLAKIFIKAGRKWWEAIIPIYNIYIFLKIVGRPGWWLLLMLIPFVNIVISLIVSIDLAKTFGKDAVIGVLTFLFAFIMYPIFAFNKDFQYVGPAASHDFRPGQSPIQHQPVNSPGAMPPSAGAPTPQPPVINVPPTVKPPSAGQPPATPNDDNQPPTQSPPNRPIV